LRYRNSLLYRLGMIHFIMCVMLFIPLLLDQRVVLGINPWIKPIKFCFSIAIYSWTMGWMMFDLVNYKKWVRTLSWTIVITMLVEIVVIIFQASRGTRSHFNFSTGFDSILFAAMGIMIGINTLAIFIIFLLFLFGKINLDKAYLTSVRLGFVVFMIGNWIGGQMIQRGGHAVGVEDGGAGVPFFNWSTIGGDLRVSHFLGLHAIQLIPLFSYTLKQKTELSLTVRTVLSVLFAIAYGAVVWTIYIQAMGGQPII